MIVLMSTFFVFIIVSVFILQFLSTLLHELGHAIVGKLLGIPIEIIQIGSIDHPCINAKYFRFSFPAIHGSLGYTQHTAILTDTWRYELYILGGVLLTVAIGIVFIPIGFLLLTKQQVSGLFLLVLAVYLLTNLMSLQIVPGRDGYHIQFLRALNNRGYHNIRYVTTANEAYAETPELQRFYLGRNYENWDND